MKPCRICGQERREPSELSHHLERAPVNPDLCLGCWIGWLEFEKFMMRATGRTIFSLQVENSMLEFLVKLKDLRMGTDTVFTTSKGEQG